VDWVEIADLERVAAAEDDLPPDQEK